MHQNDHGRHGHIGHPTSRYKVDFDTGQIFHGAKKTKLSLSAKQLARFQSALRRLGLFGLAFALLTNPSDASAAVLDATPAGLVADAFGAYADYFLDAAGTPGQYCAPAGGPSGGDELAGQFLGTCGAFNRR